MNAPRPVSQCTLCHSFGGSVSVDYMDGQTVPKAVFVLKGLIDTHSGEVRAKSEVWCPECETEYGFYEESEHMMYSVSIWPKRPRGGFPCGDRKRDDLLLRNLKVDLQSGRELYARYAVSNLLPWAIGRDDQALIFEMLDVSCELPIHDVLLGIKVTARSLEPYHARLVELAFHEHDTIRGHALECITRTRPTDELAEFADELLQEMIRRGPHWRSWYFLEKLHERKLPLDAAIPMLASGICAIAPGEGKFDQALILAKSVVKNPRYAKMLLDAFDRLAKPLDSRMVGGLKRMAKATVKAS